MAGPVLARKSAEELVVITKTYDLILWSCNHTVKFPRNHRFVLAAFLDESEMLRQCESWKHFAPCSNSRFDNVGLRNGPARYRVAKKQHIPQIPANLQCCRLWGRTTCVALYENTCHCFGNAAASNTCFRNSEMAAVLITCHNLYL